MSTEKRKSPSNVKERVAWRNMRARCYDEKNLSYHRYGGRGIRVCDRWLASYEAFLADVGPAPSPGHSLDRIDSSGNYEPGNVRWSTVGEQNRNRSTTRLLTYGGETLCLTDWAERTGIPVLAISARLDKYGWAVGRALTEPVRKSKRSEPTAQEPAVEYAPPKGRVTDIVGRRFGRLVVRSLLGMRDRVSWWRCDCDCGATKDAHGPSMIAGRVASCGCIKREQIAERCGTHGKSDTHEYQVWLSMKQRCRPDGPGNHGGRGIRVCERWSVGDGFQNFLADMGPRPSPKHSIDRIDVNGDYEPGNCRWATAGQQASNRRSTRLVTHDGVTDSLKGWARRLGMSYSLLYTRIAVRGWPPERAFAS